MRIFCLMINQNRNIESENDSQWCRKGCEIRKRGNCDYGSENKSINDYSNKRSFGLTLIEEIKSNIASYNNIDSKGKRFCLWCGKTLHNGRNRYCSDKHYENFCLKYKHFNYYMGLRKTVLNNFNYTCQNQKCKAFYPNINVSYSQRKLEIHHIIPKSEGGSDSEENFTVLCMKCHKKETKNQISKLAFQRKFGNNQKLITDFKGIIRVSNSKVKGYNER